MAADLTTENRDTGRPGERRQDVELAGLDNLELASGPRTGVAGRAWAALWPKLAAVALAVGVWQLIVALQVRPEYVLPAPATVFAELGQHVGEAEFWQALATTVRRGVVGYAVAIVVGTAVGVLVVRSRILRTAVGSMITGLQTMPSIAWFPLAILVFGLTEQAITFVVVLGAAPSIANGLIAGVDYVPPLLVRAGRSMGASTWQLYRHVILPAALPSFVAGLKQGWAFAWRSLMAGELLVVIANSPSLGARLQFQREFADTPGLLATMIVILVLGILVDAVFARADDALRRRRGLVERFG